MYTVSDCHNREKPLRVGFWTRAGALALSAPTSPAGGYTFRTNLNSFMPLQRGTRLGPYQIESPIGAGGMGEVDDAGKHEGHSRAAQVWR